jgi:hypothetical protein
LLFHFFVWLAGIEYMQHMQHAPVEKRIDTSNFVLPVLLFSSTSQYNILPSEALFHIFVGRKPISVVFLYLSLCSCRRFHKIMNNKST